jgi:hypothetical protein
MQPSSHSWKRRWVTTTQLLEEQTWLTDSALRNYIWRAPENGLEEHIRRVGRRVLIDANGFDFWIEQQQGRAA